MSATVPEVLWMNPDDADIQRVAVLRTSPAEYWFEITGRILSQFRAGVAFVVVADDATRTAFVFGRDYSHQEFGLAETIVLPGFGVRVAELFA